MRAQRRQHTGMRVLAFALAASACCLPCVASTDPPTTRVAGRVVDDEGRGLPGALVRLVPTLAANDSHASGHRFSGTWTGEDGTFVVEGRFEGKVDLRVRHDDFALWTGRAIDPDEEAHVVLVRGRPIDGRVLGRVDGLPVAGARVQLDSDPALRFGVDAGFETVTDRDGTYRFDRVMVGPVAIRVTAKGRAVGVERFEMRSATGGDPRDVDDVYLVAGAPVAGRVVDPEGEPVPGARVSIRPVDYRSVGGPWLQPTEADHQGRFELEGVATDARYVVTAWSDDTAPGTTEPFAVAPAGVDDLVVAISAGAKLRLRLVDPEGKPVTDARLRLDAREGGRFRDLTTEDDEVDVDSEGWIEIPRTVPGLYDVRADASGWTGLVRRDVSLGAGETIDLGELRLVPGAVLSGRVIGTDGKPIADAEVAVEWVDMIGRQTRRDTTGADGRFSIGGLVQLRVDVTVTATGHAKRVVDHLVEDGGEPLELRLKRSGAIGGTVALPDGSAPGAFSVKALSASSGRERSADATYDGSSFRLAGLRPGRYTVEARAEGYAPARQEVRVPEGGEVDAGTLSLAAGLTLNGHVTRGGDGAAVVGARVRLDTGSERSGPKGDYEAVTARDGRFRLEGLEPVRFTYTVVHPDYAPVEQTLIVTEDVSTLEVATVLDAGGEIRGRVVDGEGVPVPQAEIFLMRGSRGFDRRRSTADEEGVFRFPKLAPGTYSVIRVGPGTRFFQTVKTVQLKQGQVKDVELRDPPSP